jgi:hypothetical protein
MLGITSCGCCNRLAAGTSCWKTIDIQPWATLTDVLCMAIVSYDELNHACKATFVAHQPAVTRASVHLRWDCTASPPYVNLSAFTWKFLLLFWWLCIASGMLVCWEMHFASVPCERTLLLTALHAYTSRVCCVQAVSAFCNVLWHTLITVNQGHVFRLSMDCKQCSAESRRKRVLSHGLTVR